MLTQYVEEALKRARYELLADRTYGGKIPSCPGVVAFGKSLYECQSSLREILEGWLMVKIRHGDRLPSIAGINLNKYLPKAA